jgi:ORF6N domain
MTNVSFAADRRDIDNQIKKILYIYTYIFAIGTRIMATQLVNSFVTKTIPDIATRIVRIREQKVIIDSDLAALYGVETRRLNEQIRRNIKRFPTDFVFELTRDEYKALMSQTATSNEGRGGRRKLPWVFSEHGALMAASVLHSDRATQVSIFVVRAFVQLRDLLSSDHELERRFEQLTETVETHDQAIKDLIITFRDLLKTPEPHQRPIGFVTW